jgi:DNA mismatch repair protein MutS
MNDMTSATAPRGDASPMMAQYLEIKAANPDCLLFYRMGDFYELFFADAEAASRALGIALTKRGKHQGGDIPMCGVPVHAADGYLQRLIRLGHRVAVCEQMEDPAEAKRRGSKSVVRRDVVRLVTPGTLTEDALLEARSHNYLAALARLKGIDEWALAWTDISSGELIVQPVSPASLPAALARLQPSELLHPDNLLDDTEASSLLKASSGVLTPLPSIRFDSASAERRLKQHYGVAALEAFGSFGKADIAALGALLDYVQATQAGKAPFLAAPRREDPAYSMAIDAATRANLELVRTLSGERQGSLLAAVDCAKTAAGSRLLANRITAPLADPKAINERLDEVSFFLAAEAQRDAVRAALASMPDLQRCLARVSLSRGGPRDLAAIRVGLEAAQALAKRLRAGDGLAAIPSNIEKQVEALSSAPAAFAAELAKALGDDLPLLARDGGFVCAGYFADLDETRALRDGTRQVIAGLQAKYAGETGVRSLKLRHNNVLGYFVEVTAQHAPSLQASPTGSSFFHRQTIANAMRFSTAELADLDQRIAAAGERAIAIEKDIFDRLVSETLSNRDEIAAIAAAAAELDVASSLAELAARRNYARPVVDHSPSFVIEEGRHPVVEAALASEAASAFIPNSCDLSSEGKRLWLLTGPNMAGKSTFLRQNALIAVLAQAGCFVPAKSAHIGAVDRLFSRVGAADDLARGRSTFMVEMVETAAILNQASERSLVILDEIGRGTATFDGLSIAWAVVEHLHEVNRCRALFATHYHELTALASRLDGLANATVKVREWQGDVVFLHEVVPGVADRSYGIQVAKLAGLPTAVTARASEVLHRLESSETSAPQRSLADDLPLFAASRPEGFHTSRGPSQIEERLRSIAADELSPREALALIYELKQSLLRNA